MTFDLDWPHGHVTRDGRKARVVCRDLQSDQGPIVAAVMSHTGSSETIVTYYPDGKYTRIDTNSCDLHNAPAPKTRIKGWLNVFDAGEVIRLLTRSEADLQARTWTCRRRVACIPIDIEEGEGL